MILSAIFLVRKQSKFTNMFEKFSFTKKQIERHYRSALKDFGIARKSDIPDVMFRFSYDSIIKLAIAVCADHNLRIKARMGHHIELISKLSEIFDNKEIMVFANDMRTKRNKDLYGDGVFISKEIAKDYLKWVKSVFEIADDYFQKGNKLKL
jgi:hypothetical protein